MRPQGCTYLLYMKVGKDIGILSGGDSAVFERIFVFYYRKVYSYAFRTVHASWVAEEIAASIFYKLWLHHEEIFAGRKISRVEDLNGYIFAMTRNETANYFRDSRRIAQVQEQYAEQLSAEMDVQEKMDGRKCLEVINNVVESMPHMRRRVFSMSRYLEFSNSEIADMLGISKRTVEKHISNALEQLRNELATYTM